MSSLRPFVLLLVLSIKEIDSVIDGACYTAADNLTAIVLQWEYCGPPSTPLDNFARMDTDNDTVVNGMEYHTNCELRASESLFCYLDVNRDGSLSLDEFVQQYLQYFNVSRNLNRFDANGDSMFDVLEIRKYLKHRHVNDQFLSEFLAPHNDTLTGSDFITLAVAVPSLNFPCLHNTANSMDTTGACFDGYLNPRDLFLQNVNESGSYSAFDYNTLLAQETPFFFYKNDKNFDGVITMQEWELHFFPSQVANRSLTAADTDMDGVLTNAELKVLLQNHDYEKKNAWMLTSGNRTLNVKTVEILLQKLPNPRFRQFYYNNNTNPTNQYSVYIKPEILTINNNTNI